MNDPKVKLWLRVFVTIAMMALVLFLCAGTIYYWQAWLYLGLTVVSSIVLTIYIIGDPILLENRTRGGPTAESRPIQKMIVSYLTCAGIAAFIVPGQDRRFQGSNPPPWLCIAGAVFIIASLLLVFLVFKENSFGSATIEIGRDQRVISTGPYALVRHPMYSSASVYFLAMALALGSYWGLIPAALMILGFVWRLFDEEKYLADNLPGYKAYCARVRWRLIPGVF